MFGERVVRKRMEQMGYADRLEAYMKGEIPTTSLPPKRRLCVGFGETWPLCLNCEKLYVEPGATCDCGHTQERTDE